MLTLSPMLRLPTVILRHESRGGMHFDWLLGDPALAGDPHARLWTAHTDLPPTAWQATGTWSLRSIAHHRRDYLTYQGPLTADRGHVQRIDRGWIIPRLWTPDRIVLNLSLRACLGVVELRQLGQDRWRAAWTKPSEPKNACWANA